VRNKSILIVEDDPMTVKLVRVLLSEEGYDLRSTVSAEEALKVLATFKPSLILMDVQLPGKNGLELTRQLLADPEMNSSRIVALTAYGSKEDERSVLNAACDGYIVKPIDTATFPKSIRSLMEYTSWRGHV
jgi:two-component system, cell cycle response regulator DivK